MPEQPQHYFRTPPDTSSARRELPVVLAGRSLTLHTAAGVFSADRIDLGTRVLLREVPDPPGEGNLLDLGCGWGPLAITQSLLSPGATVWAVDVNERSLELTRQNARTAGCRDLRAVLPQGVPDDVLFAAIWSNPPIRVGKPVLHDMLLRWLPRLEPDGQAHLVVQRNLGADSLQAWLAGQRPAGESGGGWTVVRAGSAKGYRVLRITRG